MKPNGIRSTDDYFYLEEDSFEENSLNNSNEEFSYDDEGEDEENEDQNINNNNSLEEQSISNNINHCNQSEQSKTTCINKSNNKKRKINKKNIDANCKKRKCRTTFNKLQLNILESEFLQSNFVSNDKIELIVQKTGLDSRIIKNWFKNKRSRVMADSKLNQSSNTTSILSKPITTATLLSQKSSIINTVLNEQKECLNNNIKHRTLQPNINKSLNGLINIIQSIDSDEDKQAVKEDEKSKEILKFENEKEIEKICSNCLKLNKILCCCNISKIALNKLYRNYNGFSFMNSLNGQQFRHIQSDLQNKTVNYNEKYYFYYEFNSLENVEKVFFAL